YGPSVALRVLDHRYGVRSGRNARARHDLDALSRPQQTFKNASRADFTDAFEPRARRGRIRGPQGETVTRGTVEGRIVAVGKNRLRQDAAKGVLDFDGFTT